MVAVLVIDGDEHICELLKDILQDNGDMTVRCAHTGTDAARMLEGNRYALAIINANLPEMSGLDVAAIAANGNTSVLLISGSPEVTFKLHQFDYPYLAKPFTLDMLRVAAARVLSEHSENLLRVKASAARMMANQQTLRAAMAESDRLLDVARKQHLGRWEAVVARTKRELLAGE